MNSRLLTYSIYAGTLPFVLSGCSLYQAVQFKKPTPPAPPVARTASALQIPPDLRVMPVIRPVVTTVATTPPLGVAAMAPVQSGSVPPAVHALAAMPVPTAPPAQLEKPIFAPYSPTSSEKTPPSTWVTTPNYDFPWIDGALPDRVNEETTYGVGGDMYGRLYAKVTFGTQALAKPADPAPEVISAAAQKHKSTSLLSRWFGLDKDNKTAPVVKQEVAKPAHAAVINCEGATCLDAARDLLLADAQSKGWTMLLNRRVSLHQSFQFDRNGRVIWIENNSDGKNGLKIEYALVPLQNGK